METRSEGVNVSISTFIVSLTSSIFYPFIDPLTSMTQTRSTLVLAPPEETTWHIAGRTVGSPSFTCVLCARIERSSLAYLPAYLTLSRKGSSSLKIPCIWVGWWCGTLCWIKFGCCWMKFDCWVWFEDCLLPIWWFVIITKVFFILFIMTWMNNSDDLIFDHFFR